MATKEPKALDSVFEFRLAQDAPLTGDLLDALADLLIEIEASKLPAISTGGTGSADGEEHDNN